MQEKMCKQMFQMCEILEELKSTDVYISRSALGIELYT